jgi:hypothetical protein
MTEYHDTMAADLEPLFLELGKAVSICQALEESLCFLHAQMTHDETQGDKGAFEAAWDFHSSKTLGQTLVALRKRIEIPTELDEYLEEGVKARNRIVHGFVTANMRRVVDPKSRLEVQAELESLKIEVKKRDIVVNKLLDALFAKHGFSNDDLKRAASEYYAARNSPPEGPPHECDDASDVPSSQGARQ